MEISSIVTGQIRPVSTLCNMMHKKNTYFVRSNEPFTPGPIWRGPFNHKDATTLIADNGACGSADHLFKNIDGVMVVL